MNHGETGSGRVRIFIAGVGGQGSITATIIIGEAALAAGLEVVTSELHGMAQRGGVVQSAVVLGGLRAPTIPDGAADVLLAFEPVEALRFVAKASADRTVVLVNTRPVVPMSAGAGGTPYPPVEEVLARLRASSRRVLALDAVSIAAACGTPRALGAVLIGALAGMDLLPVERSCWRDALLARVPARFGEANLAAFDAGLERSRGT